MKRLASVCVCLRPPVSEESERVLESTAMMELVITITWNWLTLPLHVAALLVAVVFMIRQWKKHRKAEEEKEDKAKLPIMNKGKNLPTDSLEDSSDLGEDIPYLGDNTLDLFPRPKPRMHMGLRRLPSNAFLDRHSGMPDIPSPVYRRKDN